MGSKIPTARLANGTLIKVTDYEDKPQGKIRCAITGCTAELTFVSGHYRQCAIDTIEIMPCFRLKPHETHAKNCKYNISGSLGIIAKNSRSEVFKAISEKKYEFRLHVLIRALRELSKHDIEVKAEGWGENSENNKSFSNKGSLSNYLRTLRQIIELRILCESNDDLKSLVVLKFKSKTIPWSRFFFDNDNLNTFIKYYGAEKYTPPLAISGVVYRISKPVENFPYHVVELHAPFVQPDSKGVIKRTIVQVVVKNPTVMALLSINTEYVFFGQWTIDIKPAKNKVGPRNNTMIYQNVRMYITNNDHFLQC